MTTWLAALVSVLVVSLISLAGTATLLLREEQVGRLSSRLVGFAVGGLFGDAVLHLLPEALADESRRLASSCWVLAGLLAFFVLEKLLRWRHRHAGLGADVHPIVAMNLVGDALHNFVDGLLVAATYLVSLPLGLATTVAVIMHEIPQEIADLGILIHGGLTVRRALLLNLLSGLVALLGAAVGLALGARLANLPAVLLPVTAGGFLYIAGSDLVPELHREDSGAGEALLQLLTIALGMSVMLALKLVE